VCGDIDFTTSNGNIVYRENDETAYRMLENDGAYFQNLPGTEAEIDSISTELAVQQGGYKIKVLRGAEATDARFCEMSRKSELVHLATHGFFTGTIQNSELVPAISDNSLSESGLAMAGVNANLRNESFDVTQYDGILTAKELSAQDLSHVQMMVLSACQTGLGYISDDGVYGIQRGLKTSGVGAMTLSLWSVDDFATCELMRRFYERLSLQGACPDIYRAFMTARKSIMDDGVVDVYKFSAGKLASQRTSLGINKPQYTNAFILIDVL
jgi:CHAT domain-containing protein